MQRTPVLVAFAAVALVALYRNHPSVAPSPSDGDIVLLEVRRKIQRREPTPAADKVSLVEARSTDTCSPMKNRGSHFTVEIEVGTPGQRFDVIADTGSDSVIVPSCICADVGSCDPKDDCFRGTNKSSTFSIPKPRSFVNMEFGSGLISAAVAQDVVRIGNVKAKMDEGLLLMVTKELSFDGPFEGILGLGIPRSSKPSRNKSSLLEAHPREGERGDSDKEEDESEKKTPQHYSPKLFTEAAGIDHFSICFKDDGEPGVLRLGDAPANTSLATLGDSHWSLGFQGISVGKASAPVTFCDKANARSGQGSSCTAILDSGTTAIMAPREHITSLLESLCDAWPRCSSSNSSGSKSDRFQDLLLNCTDWLTEDKGLHELPDIHIQLAGPDGKGRKYSLTAWAYVNEMMQEEVKVVRKYLAGILPVDVMEGTGHKVKVCQPSFGVMDAAKAMKLKDPVWILGTPMFYEYKVGYDMSAKPPGLSLTSLTETDCGTCEKGVVGLVSSSVRPVGVARRPRLVRAPWRVPSFVEPDGPVEKSDVGQPL